MQKEAFASDQSSSSLRQIAAEERHEEREDDDKVEGVVHFQLDEAAWHGLCLQTVYLRSDLLVTSHLNDSPNYHPSIVGRRG